MSDTFQSPHHSVHAAFGLRFRSRMDWLPLSRVEDASGPFDVDVTFGTVPSSLGDEAFRTSRFDALPGRLLFRTRTIADYLIEEGGSIRVHPKPDVEKLKLCNILFGGVTGALLIQRGTLALHGCSIETPSGAVVICGDSGAGKSTLATLLLERGFRVLDDNIAVLAPGASGFLVQPGLGYLRLTGDTLDIVDKRPRGPGFPAPFETKYLHSLTKGEFCDEARPLRHVLVLDRGSSTLLRPLTGPEKFAIARRYTFVRHMAAGLGRLEDHFRLWLALAAGMPMSILGKPAEDTVYSWTKKVANLISRDQ